MVVTKSTPEKTREEIIKELAPNVDIVKDVTVLHDGRQCMIKLPKEITDFYGVKKGHKIRLHVHIKETKKKCENTFEFLK